MSDYSEQGAVPVEDAVVEDPPTVDEVLEQQRQEYPEQACTAMRHRPMSEEEQAALAAGGTPVVASDAPGADVEVEGPNSQ